MGKDDVIEVKDEDVKIEENTSSNEQEIVSTKDEDGINISEEVVATLAGIAAQEVKGVASLNANGLGEMFGRKTKGVKVQVGAKDTVIDISLIVEYGARIPDIAWEVQNKVKTQVETMTGLNVVSVNVHVQGVNMPKKKNEPAATEITSEEAPNEIEEQKNEEPKEEK